MFTNSHIYGGDTYQNFSPAKEDFGGMNVWTTGDQYIQVRFESLGQDVVVDYATICTIRLGDAYCVCTSDKFTRLNRMSKKILLNREYLRYQYDMMESKYNTEPSMQIGGPGYTKDEFKVVGVSTDRDFRIMSQLYAYYGKMAVDKAIKSATYVDALDKVSMKEYRALQKQVRELKMGAAFGMIRARFNQVFA